MKRTILLPASLLLALAGHASVANAGTAADDAMSHFQAIASGDLPKITGGYAENAQLNWIGGPLDGIYQGSKIGNTWEKFTASQGPLKLTVARLEESANPKGATVTANVQFEGKQPIKVRYVLTYQGNRIVSETWQIDPQLSLGTY